MANLDSTSLQSRKVYALLDALLTRGGRADFGAFLNWGYRPLADQEGRSARATPDDQVNADHIRLVREVIGEADLDHLDVLDLGCGRGGALSVIEADFQPCRLVGADLSPENIAACRRMLETLPQRARSRRVQIVDACALPYPPASFDIVLNIESSSAYADQAAFLREVAKVLRPGGQFIFADLLPPDLLMAFRHVGAACGLRGVLERDITENVLAARERAERIEQRIFTDEAIAAVDQDRLLSDFVGRFRAKRGSRIQQLMRLGDLRYLILQFERDDRLKPEPALAEHVQALCDRSTWLSLPAPVGMEPKARGIAPSSPWLPWTTPSARGGAPNDIHVVCLPFAGGNAHYFLPWMHHQPKDVTFCPLELPGRGTRMKEPLVDDLSALTTAMADALLSVLEDRPFALFGHSLGALCAWLLASRLALHQRPPVHLFVSGRHAPHRPIPCWQGEKRPRHLMNDADLALELAALGGTADGILNHAGLMSLTLPILRADLRLTETFGPNGIHPPLDIPMTVFAGEDDQEVSPKEMRHWLTLTRRGGALVTLPGGHFYLSAPKTRSRLIDRIAADLALARPSARADG